MWLFNSKRHLIAAGIEPEKKVGMNPTHIRETLSATEDGEELLHLLTSCECVPWVDPSVVHVNNVDTAVFNEVSLMSISLVGIKVYYHHSLNAFKVFSGKLTYKGGEGRGGGVF